MTILNMQTKKTAKQGLKMKRVSSGKLFLFKHESKVVGIGINEFSNFQPILRFVPISGGMKLSKKIF